MIPERSQTSKFAKSVFFEQYNDIDVYVEDTGFGYEKIFVELLTRAFGGKYRIATVFPLGPRGIVAGRCREMQGKFSRPSLFIIDGDLFMLAGRDIPRIEGLFTLPFYCIENILIDAEAVHHLLNEEDPIRLRGELVEEFDFEGWLDRNRGALVELFREYSVSFKLNPPAQTVKFPVSHLVSSNDGQVDEEKVRQRISMLRQATIEVVGEAIYAETKAEMNRRIERAELDGLCFVSGKDYLFPLLKTRLKSIVKTKISDINLKLRLAMRCSVHAISGLDTAVAGKPTAES